MIQWITDRVVRKGKGLDVIVGNIMLINFGAIHSSSNVCDPLYAFILTIHSNLITELHANSLSLGGQSGVHKISPRGSRVGYWREWLVQSCHAEAQESR